VTQPAPPTVALRVVRCAGCRRPLSDPESRAVGYGPECAEQEFARRVGGIVQDPLPGC
jgi:hypothetical protein